MFQTQLKRRRQDAVQEGMRTSVTPRGHPLQPEPDRPERNGGARAPPTGLGPHPRENVPKGIPTGHCSTGQSSSSAASSAERTKRKEFIPVLQVSFLVGEGVRKIPEEILFEVVEKV